IRPSVNSIAIATTGISHRRLLIGNLRSRFILITSGPLIVLLARMARQGLPSWAVRLRGRAERSAQALCIAFRPHLVKNERRKRSEVNLLARHESEQRSDGYPAQDLGWIVYCDDDIADGE